MARDDEVTRRFSPSEGADIASRLIRCFNIMTDEVIVELEKCGHPGVTAVHAFALEAIDAGANSASVLGRRLSVSKQAAAKTISVLESLGYLDRELDKYDARRMSLRVTPRGYDMLDAGGQLFDDICERWAKRLGRDRFEAFDNVLETLVGIQAPEEDE